MAKIAKKIFAPPAEVTSYFENKGLRPAFSWLDVWGEEHASQFTVAKATEAELLAAFRETIATSIREGEGIENWKPRIRQELVRLGWGKPRMVADPAGIDPDRMVDFMSDRRLKTIFWSNVNSARAAGQWDRAQRTRKALPYILYMRTTSADPRPEHLSWVGIILPVDDPFWRTHWPPNGWGCKCQVRQISAREAARLLGRAPKEGGVFYTDKAPDLGPDIPHVNRRTGEVTMVPPGIDPGWQTNPGLTRAGNLADFLGDALTRLPVPARETAIRDIVTSGPFSRLIEQRARARAVVPIAPVSERMRERVATTARHIWLSSGSAVHILDEHAERGLTSADLALAIATIVTGELRPPRSTHRGGGDGNTLVFLAEIAGRRWRAAIKLLADEAYLVSFHEKGRVRK